MLGKAGSKAFAMRKSRPGHFVGQCFSAPPTNAALVRYGRAWARFVFANSYSERKFPLMVGAVGAGVSLVIGVLWGAVAGYLGGRVGTMR